MVLYGRAAMGEVSSGWVWNQNFVLTNLAQRSLVVHCYVPYINCHVPSSYVCV